MTNEVKNILMQPLYKIAEHNGLQDVTLVSFKKRLKLLEPLKEKNIDAWTVLNNFIESQIKLDRIKNDKEKQEKNASQWNAEIARVEIEKNTAEEQLNNFCKNNNIII